MKTLNEKLCGQGLASETERVNSTRSNESDLVRHTFSDSSRVPLPSSETRAPLRSRFGD
jgi:hypothetical protein